MYLVSAPCITWLVGDSETGANLCASYLGCACMYAWRMVGDQGGVGDSELFAGARDEEYEFR